MLEYFSDSSTLCVVYDAGLPVEVAILSWTQDTLFHPYADSLHGYNRTSVNNLLYWRIIEFACERGLSTFDLGRSHREQGTYRYKVSWSAKPVQLCYHYCLKVNATPPRKPDHPTYQVATGAWKHLPLAIANSLGPRLFFKVL